MVELLLSDTQMYLCKCKTEQLVKHKALNWHLVCVSSKLKQIYMALHFIIIKKFNHSGLLIKVFFHFSKIEMF